ncbi:MAG: hypothetical protein E7265_05895 [Lachnospiraceae bacterium]|nr:hypothetical protein [Lachnospiraceae bacterium]
MNYYKLYDMIMATDMEFPQLIVYDAGLADNNVTCDIEIFEGNIPSDIVTKSKEKAYEFLPDKSYLVNKTCFLYVCDGKRITYKLKPEGIVRYLQSYILGFGMSMIAMQRNMLAIHCSALACNGEAVLIAGESGSGKSTLATVFLENGYKLMADDMALIETCENSADNERRVIAKSAFPYQKLCRNVVEEKGYNPDELIYINEYKDKFLAPCRELFQEETVPVKALIYLYVTQNDEVTVNEAEGLDKFHICAGNLFLRKLLGNDRYAPHIGQKCLEAASAMPVYCIGRPQNGDTTDEVVNAAFSVVKKSRIH